MTPKPILVIFLHGIGASGAQLMPLAGAWRDGLPTEWFTAPDAPFHSSYGTGHTWFSVDGSELRPDRIHTIRQAFDALIHDVVQRAEFANDLDRVAFVGVSQGAIMGLDGVASGRWPIGAMVSFAGLLPPFPIAAASQPTPILLVHGQDDRTIPPIASTVAASRLRAAGFDVGLNLLPSAGHTVSPEGAQIALGFLQKAFL
jgi:phospholipase/carboxylesterase